MTADDKVQAIFGATDGLTSTVAVVIAQLIAGTQHSLIAGGFAIAIAAGVGMGWSEWISDASGNYRRALVMTLATLLASALPIFPFLFLWEASGVVVCGGVSALLAVGIALLRGTLTPDSRRKAFAVTLGGIAIVGTLVSIPSLLVGP
jgi:VIT1/CCC1 family predicted Fe2+/Mn2+ transporter